MTSVTLLGPQRFRMSAKTAVRELGVEGPIAVVNAGWQERESDDAELDEVLDGRTINLALYRRYESLLEADPEFAAAEGAHDVLLDQQQALYSLRLHQAVEAAYGVWLRPSARELRDAAVADAIEAVRALDEWHLDAVERLEREFVERHRSPERLAVVEHRDEVAGLLASAAALVVTGGHVGVLLRCLRLFDVQPGELPVVAWSAGAMALSEKIVLFNDVAARGYGHAEVYQRGVGVYRGVVPLPHARRRLRLNDPVRVAAFARRFPEMACVILDDGVRYQLPEGGGAPVGAPVLSGSGQISVVEAAA